MEKLKEISKEITLLSHSNALLAWDQETFMPQGAVEERAEQIALIEGLIHDRMTSDEMQSLLQEKPDDLAPFDKDFIRVLKQDVEKSIKLPKALVQALARTASKSQAAWVQAREKNDFSIFAHHLDEIITLVKEKAECLGYEGSPYDALLDEYEPGMKTATVKEVFALVGSELSDFISVLKDKPQVDNSILFKSWDIEKQKQLSNKVLGQMHYNFQTGRNDVSAHPFTTTLGFDDVRITSRYDEQFLPMGLYGSIHEGGHALYEQGFDGSLKYSHLASGTSLGIHESQSRLWENLVGRSQSFVNFYYPTLKELFPENLSNVNETDLYRALNRVEPSFIRVESDEVTYNLHIILRFTIEREIIEDGLKINELENRWNELSQQLLGIRPEKSSDGILQDVHWSMGAIGYFPTYALGNIYASQFFHSMNKDLGSVDSLIGDGKFDTILQWLRENIHQYGRRKDALTLCKDITGETLNPQYFLDYVKTKYDRIYD